MRPCNHKNSSLDKNEQKRKRFGCLEDFEPLKARLTVLKDGPGDEGQLGIVLCLTGVQSSSLFARDAATTRQSKALWVYVEE